MEDRIEKHIQIAAPQARVWQALTDYRQFGQWFYVKLEGPFVAGQGVGGEITWPGFEHLRMEVVVKSIQPESHFAYTWHPYAVDPAVDYSQETPTLVEFNLSAVAGGTSVTVVESGFENIPAARRGEAFLRNDNGWRQQMENIRAYVLKA